MAERLYAVQDVKAVPALLVSLADAGFRERTHLQEWVIANPDMLGDDVMVVTSEFGRWVGVDAEISRDRIDVLGLDSAGHLVVVELKRGRAPDTVQTQALKYAALVRRFTRERLAEVHADYRRQRGEDLTVEQALRDLEAHAGRLDDTALAQPRIVVMAEGFGRVLLGTALYLMEQGIPLRLLRVTAWRHNEQVLVTVSQELPLPDAEDFLLTPESAVKRHGERVESETRQERSLVDRLVASETLPVGTVLHFDPTGLEIPALEQALADNPALGTAHWTGNPVSPLRWDGDGQEWPIADLTSAIVGKVVEPDSTPLGFAPRLWHLDGDQGDMASLGVTPRARRANRPVAELLAEAHANGVGAVWDAYLTKADGLGWVARGYVSTVMLTPPNQGNRCLVWLSTKPKKGQPSLGFGYDMVSEITGRASADLRGEFPDGSMSEQEALARLDRLVALVAPSADHPWAD